MGAAAAAASCTRPGNAHRHVLLLPLLFLYLLLSPTATTAWEHCEDDDIYGIYGHCGETVRPSGGGIKKGKRLAGTPFVPPSPLCCSFIADAEKVECVCRYLVTREVEKHMSPRRLVRAAGRCGAHVKPGTKCGRYTTPPESE